MILADLHKGCILSNLQPSKRIGAGLYKLRCFGTVVCTVLMSLYDITLLYMYILPQKVCLTCNGMDSRACAKFRSISRFDIEKLSMHLSSEFIRV